MAKKTTELIEGKEPEGKTSFADQLTRWRTSEEYINTKKYVLSLLTPITRLTPRLFEMLDFVNPETQMSFWDMPASTKFHNNSLGGLVRHSLLVWEKFHEINQSLPEEKRLPKDSEIICGLFHDFCKIQNYKPNILKSGELSKSDKAFVTYNMLPLGHGEKSVILLQQVGIQLTFEEMILIRYHMGWTDFSYKGEQSYLTKAYPYHLSLYLADQWATMLEGEDCD